MVGTLFARRVHGGRTCGGFNHGRTGMNMDFFERSSHGGGTWLVSGGNRAVLDWLPKTFALARRRHFHLRFKTGESQLSESLRLVQMLEKQVVDSPLQACRPDWFAAVVPFAFAEYGA